jgi:hypothetical protein
MKLYLIVPLALVALSALWVWIVNRRPTLSGALWPKGMTLGGEVDCPDVSYDGDLVLGCSGRFGAIRCRSIEIARGADVSVRSIEASWVKVRGRLKGVKQLAAGRRLLIRGELKADDVQSPRIVIGPKANATVLTVTGTSRIERHPKAVVKGFFDGASEIFDVGLSRQADVTLTDAQTSLQ